jgi:hypothetical protein
MFKYKSTVGAIAKQRCFFTRMLLSSAPVHCGPMSCHPFQTAIGVAPTGRMMPSAFARAVQAMDARMITTITTAAT